MEVRHSYLLKTEKEIFFNGFIYVRAFVSTLIIYNLGANPIEGFISLIYLLTTLVLFGCTGT